VAVIDVNTLDHWTRTLVKEALACAARERLAVAIRQALYISLLETVYGHSEGGCNRGVSINGTENWDRL
jgi:hypothetical protein